MNAMVHSGMFSEAVFNLSGMFPEAVFSFSLNILMRRGGDITHMKVSARSLYDQVLILSTMHAFDIWHTSSLSVLCYALNPTYFAPHFLSQT